MGNLLKNNPIKSRRPCATKLAAITVNPTGKRDVKPVGRIVENLDRAGSIKPTVAVPPTTAAMAKSSSENEANALRRPLLEACNKAENTSLGVFFTFRCNFKLWATGGIFIIGRCVGASVGGEAELDIDSGTLRFEVEDTGTGDNESPSGEGATIGPGTIGIEMIFGRLLPC